MNAVNLQLAKLDVQPLDYLLKVIIILRHEPHGLLLVHLLRHEFLGALVVGEQHEEDVAVVARDLHQVNPALDLVEVAVEYASLLRDLQFIPADHHAGGSLFSHNFWQALAYFSLVFRDILLISVCGQSRVFIHLVDRMQFAVHLVCMHAAVSVGHLLFALHVHVLF